MNTKENNMDAAFRDYLYAFKNKIKWELGNFLQERERLLREEPSEMKEEINKQFYEAMAEQLALELAENFNTDPEAIAMFLETFNIQEWLDRN